MRTASTLPETGHYAPEELDASGFFAPETKHFRT
jgi:hypothetical protein